MSRPRAQTPGQLLLSDVRSFGRFLYWYSKNRSYRWFVRFESVKDVLVDVLYKKRGRYGRPVLHVATIGLVFAVMSLGPLVFNQSEENKSEQAGRLLANNVYGSSFYTQQAEEVRQFRGGQVITHTVAEGDTVSSIATRYGLQPDTIIWENNLTKTAKLKPGDELRILPLDGVRHKVSRGETIYSIGKKYGLEGSEVQVVVDYPFNEFLNDETFELATGQWLIVPDGIMPAATIPGGQPGLPGRTLVKTPDAGSVTATGNFVWPAAGGISQGYRFYHKAIDISNKSGGAILAADSGTVVVAGWVDNSGYGNRIMIDHGNGYVTLYGHLSVVQVSVGQRVNRGDIIGQMGSTGRSTGTHLHFEIRQGSVLNNPLSFL